jgi:hypothetical protein
MTIRLSGCCRTSRTLPVERLTPIHAVREPFQVYLQTSDYGYWSYLAGEPAPRLLEEIYINGDRQTTGLTTDRLDQKSTVIGAA